MAEDDPATALSAVRLQAKLYTIAKKGTHNMKKLTVVVCMLSCIALTSCLVENSQNPLDCPSGTGVDPSPYLGQWRLTTVLGSAPGETNALTITQGASGVLTAVYMSATSTNALPVLLTSINGTVMASVQYKTNVWKIMAVGLDGNGSQLTLRAADSSVIATDIKAGSLSGNVDDQDPNWKVITITAGGPQLRTYFAGKTNLFGNLAVFQKLP